MRVTIKASTIGTAFVLAIVPLLTNAPLALALAPPNDDFADAKVLSGPLPLTVTGTTVDASSEPGEPDHGGFEAFHSVWFEWTADLDGLVMVDGCAGPLSATIAVYTGDSVDALTRVSEDVIPPGCLGFAPVVTLDAVAGTTFHIAIDSSVGEDAPFELAIRTVTRPANDDFADAEPISGTLPIVVDGTNVDASSEPGEPNFAAHSVWFTWTPEVSETVVLDACVTDGFTPEVSVFVGTDVDALTSVGTGIDLGSSCPGSGSVVRLDAAAGTPYRIVVDDVFSVGTFQLRIRIPVPPANDAFVGAETISGPLPIAVAGSNIDATKEAGEPDHAGDPGGSSVWYVWTSTVDGLVIIDPCPDGPGGVISVYTGDEIDSLVEITSAFVFQNCDTAAFEASTGATYRIAVDGVLTNTGVQQGSFVLRIRLPDRPENDDFASATVISGSPVINVTGTNADATKEPGEPDHAGFPGGRSVWWSWTATISDTITIDTCDSGFDTLLAVYVGDSLGSLTEVASNDESVLCGSESLVTFQSTAGTTYHIAVDGFLGSILGGTGTVHLFIGAPPPNDDFAAAEVLAGELPITVSSTTALASKEPGEPFHGGNRGGHSLWYSWTPTQSGAVEIGTCDEAINGLIGVYTGDSLATLTEVAGDHTSCYPGAFVIIEATAGTTYWIAVDDFTSDVFGTSFGPFTLTIAAWLPPENDDFADATALAGPLTISTTGANVGATNEPNEPDLLFDPGGASIWYAWTAEETEPVSIDTCGSEVNTLLAIYAGDSLESLTLIASNQLNIGCFNDSVVYFTATAGTTYRISVDGMFRDRGTIQLHVRAAGPPANDDFADAAGLGGPLPLNVSGSTLDATRQPGEPRHAGNRGVASVWYAWASDDPQPVIVDTCDSTFNTLLGVYEGGSLGSLSQVAANDNNDSCGDGGSVATFDAAGGAIYRIAVDGWTDSFRWDVGYFDLTIRSACTETLAGPLSGTLKVSSGIACLDGVTLDGTIRVAPGAQLWALDSEIVGSVTADGAARVVVCGTTIDGPVKLVGGSSVTLGDPQLGCAPNAVDGPVTVKDTAGPSVIAGNRITGKLACTNNVPAPVDRGFPNEVLGPATGQCAALAGG